MGEYKRITINPEQCAGMPCIRGLRIPVATIVAMLADGITEADILRDLPDLQAEDIREALRFAAEMLQEREMPFVGRN